MLGFTRVTALLMLAALPGGCGAPRGRGTAKPRNINNIDQLIGHAARRHGVRAALVRGVVAVESSYRPDARSSVGARGLMQLMPRTAAALARKLDWPDYDIEDPAFNIEAGTHYLAYLLRRFDGDESLALAAYHTGPSRVARWVRAGKPLPAYSKRYIRAVLTASRLGPRPAHRGRRGLTDDDRSALRQLLRSKLYGPREDEPPLS